jgi:hypothetical protein
MTTPADVRTDGEAFAACLAGRPVPAGAQGLAAFTDAVRASATAPGRPNAALAELLATGLLVPNQEPSRGTAGRPARTSRKRPHVLISTLTAKFAAAGAVAKAAAAGGVVAVALTGATTTVALTSEEPPPAVVEDGGATDGTEALQDTPDGPTDPATEPTGDLTGEPTTPAQPTPTGAPTSPQPTSPEPTTPTESTPPSTSDRAGDDGSGDGALDDPAPTPATDVDHTPAELEAGNHGQRVSEAARDDVANREQMRDVAHENRDQRRAERATQVEEPVVSEPVTEQQVNGKGNGNANGNGKNGK